MPVPSRRTAKAILPDERTCVTHARTTTDWPACEDSSAMRTKGTEDMTLESGEWRGACAAPSIPNGRAGRCGLDGRPSRAEPSMLHGGSDGSKGGTDQPRLGRFT